MKGLNVVNNAARLFGKVVATASEHKPAVLLGFGIGTGILATVKAVEVTPKALILIEQEKRKQNQEQMRNEESPTLIRKLSIQDTIKVCWKLYLPVVALEAASISLLVGSHRESARRSAALYTLYSVSEQTLKDYREEVKEAIGEKKERNLSEKVATRKASSDSLVVDRILDTGEGNTIFYEPITKHYFKSSKAFVDKGINALNKKLRSGSEPDICFNDLLTELRLPELVTKHLYDLIWDGNSGEYIDYEAGSMLTVNDEPCMVLDWSLAGCSPHYRYEPHRTIW